MKRIPAMLGALPLLLLLTVASCTSTLSDEPTTDTRAISFMPAAETRAAVEGGTLPDDFLVWGGYSNTPLFKGETVHPDGSYENGMRYWVPGTYLFYAIYPATIKDKTTFSNGTFTVKDFDCSETGADAVDLMTAASEIITYQEGSNPPGSVNLPFQHELAKVKFTVKSENTVAIVSSFKVYGVNYQGTLAKGQTAIWNSVTACTETNTPYKLENFTFNTTNGFEKDMLGDVLLIPDNDLTDAKLYIAYRYQGETTDRTSTINLQTTAITQWEAGKSYHYTLTIKRGTLTVTVTVADWKEEDTSVSWG